MFAVKLYSSDPTGIPDGWPSVIILLSEGDQIPDGYIGMDDAQLADQKASVQAAFDSWNTAFIIRTKAINSAISDHSDRSKYGRQVLQEFELYCAQKVMDQETIASIVGLLGPLAGMVGFGFLNGAAILMQGLPGNSFIDSAYLPTILDVPAYSDNETIREHFINRLMEVI